MPGCIPMYDDDEIADIAKSLAIVLVSVGNSFRYIFNSLPLLKISCN